MKIIDLDSLRAKADAVTAVTQKTQFCATAGSKLLDEVEAFLQRFVAFPNKHAPVAVALWIAHAHAMEAWVSTPRIAFLSPEAGSGKTRTLEVMELLVPRPVQTISATPAYIIRKVSDAAGRPTLLFDEIDTVFGTKAREGQEDLRALLNAGHRKGATVGRCGGIGRTVTPEDLPAYCAVALAGLGDLPITILTRSIVIRMRKRTEDERVTPYRRRDEEEKGTALHNALAVWLASIEGALADTRPTMPAGIDDRDADVWEALITVADAAGGEWPVRARDAAVALLAEGRSGQPSLGVRLLTDLHTIFQDREYVTTEELLRRLALLDEAPWGDLRGKPIDARGLSQRLRPYGVGPTTVRTDGEHQPAKGYRRSDLHDPWLRYVAAAKPKPKPKLRLKGRPVS